MTPSVFDDIVTQRPPCLFSSAKQRESLAPSMVTDATAFCIPRQQAKSPMRKSLALDHRRHCATTSPTQTLHYAPHLGRIPLGAWRLKFPSKLPGPYPTLSEMAGIFCNWKPFCSHSTTQLHSELEADLRQEERKSGVGRLGFQDHEWRRPRDMHGLQGYRTRLALGCLLPPLCSQSCVHTGIAHQPHTGLPKGT